MKLLLYYETNQTLPYPAGPLLDMYVLLRSIRDNHYIQLSAYNIQLSHGDEHCKKGEMRNARIQHGIDSIVPHRLTGKTANPPPTQLRD